MENSKKSQDLNENESTHFWNLIKNEFTLNSRHLSDIKEMSEGLPDGIFYKRYTGLGATYCELKADRDSIIVFPFIKLAWEKHQNYDSFYVGTRPDGAKITEDDIADFIKVNPKGKPIKFCVVAESIDKVIDGIKKAGMDPFSEFFLVLDEVEILQTQVGLRKNLPVCFEYFLEFKEKCLVSATMIQFTSKEISKLDTYTVDVTYDIKNPLKIQRYKGEPHLSLANDLIKQIENGEINSKKILIGINSTKAISQMISIFEKAGITDLSVLCGDGSQDKFEKKYTSKGIVKKKLQAQINFATSAYWNGIDIEERFIPYAVSLNTRLHHQFTYENIIQFIGRCRKPKNYPATLILPESIREDFNIDPIKAVDRVNDLHELIQNIEENIRSKNDRKVIRKALTDSSEGLIFKSIKNGKPKVNELLGDFELYREQTIERLAENGKLLIEDLKNYFHFQDMGLTEIQLDVEPDSDDVLLEKKLSNFLSQLDEKYSDFKLIDHIEKHWEGSIKVAAFWYLFGRKVLKDEAKGKELAEKISQDKNYGILISNILLDGIRFYTYHQSEFNNFLSGVKGNREGRIKGESFVSQIQKWKNHLPHIFKNENGLNRKGATFLKYYFELDSKKTGGTDNFYLDKSEKLKPFFFYSKYALKVVENLGKENKPKTKLSKKNLSAKFVINFEL